MSDNVLKLYFSDLTEDAQKRVTDFDDELDEVVLNSTEPMIGVRKRSKQDKELIDIITKMRDALGDRTRGVIEDAKDDCDCANCQERRAKVAELKKKVESFGSNGKDAIQVVGRTEPKTVEDWD